MRAMTRRIALGLPLAFVLATASCTCGSGGYDTGDRPRERKAAPDDGKAKKPKKKQHRLDLSGKPTKFGEGLKFTEGPAANRAGDMFFSAFRKDQILRIDRETEEVSVHLEDVGGAQGLMFDAEDRLWLALEKKRAIARVDDGDKVTVVADRWQGKRLNGPVDLVLDSKGGLYFTDPWFKNFREFKDGDDQREIDVEAVYHLASDGTVTQIIGDLIKPTGVLLSLDENTLYVTDYDDGSLMAYPIEEDRSKVGKGKVVSFDLSMPNGMALDTDGRVYVAASGGVHLFKHNGKPDGTIHTTIRLRNVGFGGSERNYLYMAAGNALWRRELSTTGATPHIPELMKELLAKKKDAGGKDGTGDDAEADTKADDAKGDGDAKADAKTEAEARKKKKNEKKADDGAKGGAKPKKGSKPEKETKSAH